ncbi:acetyl-CoA hydrolase/transferase C-terminal domain-containing protein [Idiomarina xiamenensis]|uniref:Acetyl-CoA hydrolase/transferase C-terminal domain-containing protein n=1 Tax=Idiomarina xiamenensis 10-D-4 TaxID=740709 RepID=K2KQJ4_9GAMM|nr:acetyl-CoA hydrolase/transferase C-terminal domain-containing protein [Idiomarina xiamenensis]EKE84714.1 hypothetical protein A10D4_03850 [Idiomarina xiamenensis 10-D-4]
MASIATTANARPAQSYSDADAIAEALIQRLGKRIVLGLPLGIGKANHVANALVRRAQQDSQLSLTIFTALTLEAPALSQGLPERFLSPLRERLFGGYPALLYAQLQRQGQLPANIQVHEFFLSPGRWLGQAHAQQHYVSVNYSQALALLIDLGVNVIAQWVAADEHSAQGLNLSSNPDLTVDLFRARARGELDFVAVAELHPKLPAMAGEARLQQPEFDLLLQQHDAQLALFTPPLQPVLAVHYAIGLHVSRLIADAGTLQIGIGAIGDAISHCLRLRQQQTEHYQQLLQQLPALPTSLTEHKHPFQEGLYACTEMLVDGMLHLVKHNIIRREVDGAIIHAAFFTGSEGFFQTLNELSEQQRQSIAMMSVNFTNRADSGDSVGKQQQRQHARFINSAMMVTLTGAVISDGVADSQVVSGVGGQYDFVSQATQLSNARSIITLPATRMRAGRVESTIKWQYPHCTIPRHLRDIFVTEYGVADTRYRSDADVIAALLCISDSRFQEPLRQQAVAAGKLPASYQIPASARNNYPARINAALAQQTTLPWFPLGTQFTTVEQHLVVALQRLNEWQGNRRWLLKHAPAAYWRQPATAFEVDCLARLQLQQPGWGKARVERGLVLWALRQTANE